MSYNRKHKSKENFTSKKLFWWVIGIVLFYFFLKVGCDFKNESSVGGYKAAIDNYGREIKILAGQFDLPRDYLMAVIMLESSGRKDIPPRFEQSVYNKLKSVQDRKLATLENITYEDIKDASDDALRNLASSWGPFQLMGYKCLHLDVKIKDLRGANSLYWGVYWIDKTYGSYLRKGRFEDGFHIHNTGHPVPKNGKYKTYDKDYVKKGLEYMDYFKNNF